jgi:hypothetical protein
VCGPFVSIYKREIRIWLSCLCLQGSWAHRCVQPHTRLDFCMLCVECWVPRSCSGCGCWVNQFFESCAEINPQSSCGWLPSSPPLDIIFKTLVRQICNILFQFAPLNVFMLTFFVLHLRSADFPYRFVHLPVGMYVHILLLYVRITTIVPSICSIFSLPVDFLLSVT